MAILITGATGYIGSHICVQMLNLGYEIIAIDNLYNSNIEVINRIQKITGKQVTFYKEDILNQKALKDIFKLNKIDAVIHLAALKSIKESVENPLMYYKNNINGTISLLEVMKKFNVKKIVFSSSATVYDPHNKMPLKEGMSTNPTNPYGRTKLFGEEILKDIYNFDNTWSVMLLRYFNPVGADKSTLIGEDPNEIPNNLMTYITQVAIGKMEKLYIFANDYDTPDGTGVRDYIHISDLASGHIKAVEWVLKNTGIQEVNLGTGKGSSVLELLKTFMKVSGKEIPYEITKRRIGDLGEVYADVSKAKKLLNWESKHTLEEMCLDSWNWQKNNPNGYKQ